MTSRGSPQVWKQLRPGWRSPQHAHIWLSSLERYAVPRIGKMPISEVTSADVGVGHDPSRGAAYVEGWVAALEEDPREIRRAAADAQKISDFVLARTREREVEREPVAATRAPDPQHAARPELPLPLPKRSSGPSR